MAMTLSNSSTLMALGETNKNNNLLTKSLKKVASGMKINSAQDDASGYSISEKMRSNLRALNQDVSNMQNGQSLLKTAEGAVQSTVDILRTLKEKAINAANDTNTDDDRATIQKEINRYVDQIDDNANVTYNGKYLLNNSTPTITKTVTFTSSTRSETIEGDDGSAEAHIIKALNSEWFQSCLNLINQSYGMSFDEAGTYVNEINVQFTHESGDTLAYVRNYYSPGVGEATQLDLNINMNYYSNIDKTSTSGYTDSSAGYLDRTLAHELVHAVMAANIKNFNDLPKYLKEGLAELVHGIDDQRTSTIAYFAQQSHSGDVAAVLAGTYDESDSNNVSDAAYGVGYSFLHYLAKYSVDNGHSSSQQDAIKTLMSTLDNSAMGGTTAYNDAIQTLTGMSQTAFEANYVSLIQTNGVVPTTNSDAFNNTMSTWNDTVTFLRDKVGIKLAINQPSSTSYILGDNEDTGSVSGSDMNGGSAKTPESIVPETEPISSWVLPTTETTTFDGGLTAIWPSNYIGTTKITITYETTSETHISPMPFYFQSGTRANQNVAVKFADMRSTALGLRDDDGKAISVVTRDKAQNAIAVFEAAIDAALDEQTNIGALQNRFDYSIANLTVAGENTQGSESTIRDADMAAAMTAYTKNNVLMQASQSMLAQANQNASSVLSLLQ